MKRLIIFMASAFFVLALSACGGGDNSQPTQTGGTPNDVPDDVNASVSTEIESNDTMAQSNLLMVGETMGGSINSGGDVDWFSIYSSGGTYTINVNVDGVYRESSGTKWIVTLFDGNSNEVFKFDVDQEHSVSVDINLVNPGNYYISINHNYDFISNNDPYYLLITPSEVNASVSNEIESNETMGQSNLLTFGETMSGSINIGGDVDWFSMYSSGGTYTINLNVDGVYRESSGTKWIVTLFDGNSNEVFKFDVDQEHSVSVDINLVNPGNYYISINHNYDFISNNDPYYLLITSQ